MMHTAKRPTILINAFILSALVVSNSLAGPDVKMIDTAQLHLLVVDNAYRLEGGREKHCAVIDARTKKDYDEAHIFSAISIPVRDFEKLLGLLPKDKEALLVVYCNDRKFETSRTWAGKAAAAGYTNIVIYSDGFPAWKQSKMPTVSSPSGPLTTLK
jgi:rhodanese-related sulfurtransferase